jgi:UDP-N-acetyl-D-glucosamine dehydrogenase
LSGADCVVILTDHAKFNFKKIVRSSRLLVDTRNATKGLPQGKIVRL